MTRLKVTVLLGIAAAALFIAGLWVGIREGSKLALWVDQPPKGEIALRILSISKDGTHPERIQQVLELYVDQGLVGAYRYLNSPFRLVFESPARPYLGLFWEMEPNASIEKFTVDLANYRKANASPLREYWSHFPGETAEQKAMTDEMMERQRENARIVDLMVDRYASKR